jgi:hypothetical protein
VNLSNSIFFFRESFYAFHASHGVCGASLAFVEVDLGEVLEGSACNQRQQKLNAR